MAEAAAMANTGYEAESEAPRQVATPAPAAVKLGPIEVTEKHENFVLDKKFDDDETINKTNARHILCQFCEIILIPEGNATKVRHEVDMIENTLREYHRCNAFWHVDSLTKFLNIEVHQLDQGLKYLCCLSCQSAILGYQVIAEPHKIYIACERVKEEI